jgi:hypothetical protein
MAQHNMHCFIIIIIYIYIYMYIYKEQFNVSDVFDSICSHQHVSAAIMYVILTETVIIFNCYVVTGT